MPQPLKLNQTKTAKRCESALNALLAYITTVFQLVLTTKTSDKFVTTNFMLKLNIDNYLYKQQ
ncbi:hypothetical protein ABK16_10140 [Vibrio parahaemolyticus]|nr:hypothetical protein ABK16_10140 [Vibrio parahaemolyticus]